MDIKGGRTGWASVSRHLTLTKKGSAPFSMILHVFFGCMLFLVNILELLFCIYERNGFIPSLCQYQRINKQHQYQ